MENGYDLDPTTEAARALQAGYEARSAEATSLPGARLDIAYGAHPRQKLDIFSAGPNAPVLVFFHGGYWRAGSKDARRFPALDWTPRGISWVAVNYRLTPEHSLDDAVEDAKTAVAWLAQNGADFGIDAGQLHVTGNSAGGHLAAMAAARGGASVRSLCAISGLFDLRPLVDAKGNDWLNLTDGTARDLSPINSLPPPELPVLIGWGGTETDAFKSQAAGYADACSAQGSPVEVFESPNADHFQIIGEYGRPDAPLFKRLEALIKSAT